MAARTRVNTSPTAREIRADQTTLEAKSVIAAQNQARIDKTIKLRELRLAKGEAESRTEKPEGPKKRAPKRPRP